MCEYLADIYKSCKHTQLNSAVKNCEKSLSARGYPVREKKSGLK